MQYCGVEARQGKAGRCRSDVSFSFLRCRGRGEGSRQQEGNEQMRMDGMQVGLAVDGPLILDQDR